MYTAYAVHVLYDTIRFDIYFLKVHVKFWVYYTWGKVSYSHQAFYAHTVCCFVILRVCSQPSVPSVTVSFLSLVPEYTVYCVKTLASIYIYSITYTTHTLSKRRRTGEVLRVKRGEAKAKERARRLAAKARQLTVSKRLSLSLALRSSADAILSLFSLFARLASESQLTSQLLVGVRRATIVIQWLRVFLLFRVSLLLKHSTIFFLYIVYHYCEWMDITVVTKYWRISNIPISCITRL